MTEREYNDCVKNYADNVYRFVLKNCQHVEDSKDLVQVAFEKLWINREKVNNEKCKSYLFTVAYNAMIDLLRKKKRVQLEDNFTEGAMGYADLKYNSQRIIEEAFMRLGEVSRSLVLLKDYEGYSYEEIGIITKLNPSQVKVYLHRARIQLRAYIVSPENVV